MPTMRSPHHLEDFKLRRQANGAKENWFLFSPEFSNYAAQTAYEVATYFDINLQVSFSVFFLSYLMNVVIKKCSFCALFS
jgi:hypothetical protein